MQAIGFNPHVTQAKFGLKKQVTDQFSILHPGQNSNIPVTVETYYQLGSGPLTGELAQALTSYAIAMGGSNLTQDTEIRTALARRKGDPKASHIIVTKAEIKSGQPEVIGVTILKPSSERKALEFNFHLPRLGSILDKLSAGQPSDIVREGKSPFSAELPRNSAHPVLTQKREHADKLNQAVSLRLMHAVQASMKRVLPQGSKHTPRVLVTPDKIQFEFMANTPKHRLKHKSYKDRGGQPVRGDWHLPTRVARDKFRNRPTRRPTPSGSEDAFQFILTNPTQHVSPQATRRSKRARPRPSLHTRALRIAQALRASLIES